MRTVVVGSGNVGSALRDVLRRLDDEVLLARRRPQSADEVPIDGAARAADRVVLAVPFSAVDDVVPRLDLRDGQLMIDATNPFGRPVPDGLPSGGAHVQRLGADARVVKCFNVIGFEHMTHPRFPGGRALMPVCGDDAAARRDVVALAESAGFEAVDIGGLEHAHLVEHAGLLWAAIARSSPSGRAVAFGLLHRDEPAAPWEPR